MDAVRDAARRQPVSQGYLILSSGLTVVVATVLVGRFLGIGPVREWHESSFSPIVEVLQRNDALIDVSSFLTDLGHLNINYVMLAALGVCAWLRPSCGTRAWLFGLTVTALALRPFQAIVSRLVDGSTPIRPWWSVSPGRTSRAGSFGSR